MRRVNRQMAAAGPLEPRERARAAATCVLDLLRDLVEPARNLDRLTGHEEQLCHVHLEAAPASVAAESAHELIRIGPPLEPRLLLVAADRVPVDCVLQRLQLGLESVRAPAELGDGSVIARAPTAEPQQHGPALSEQLYVYGLRSLVARLSVVGDLRALGQ